MSIRALRDWGAIHPAASILGVGAGTEPTTFFLTNHVLQVFSTDLYLAPGAWGREAAHDMLTEPERFAPFPFRRERLVVQHMSGTRLEYPENTFDGIFSSSSIEHFGSFDDIAHAAFEMGRVLKPGGILTLSTEYRLVGRASGVGLYGLRLFSLADLHRYVVEASGLELVDAIDAEVSGETRSSIRRQGTVRKDFRPPHLGLWQRGYTFCSVHLALRKGSTFPFASNEWADPRRSSPALDPAASRRRAGLVSRSAGIGKKAFWISAVTTEAAIRERPVRTLLPLALLGGVGTAGIRAAGRRPSLPESS